MKKSLFLFALLQLIDIWSFAQSSVQHLLIENRVNPIGLDIAIPRLSWQLMATKQNVQQTAYEIRVSTDAASVAKGTVWQSGRVTSDQSVHVPYAGPALKPGQRYFWAGSYLGQYRPQTIGLEPSGALANGLVSRGELESQVDRAGIC